MDRRLLAALFRPGSRLSLEADSSDADLLGRFVATADDAAFAEIVRRHGPLVWGVCRKLLPDSADAEDAFQATFLALVQSPRSVRRAASLPGFLHGVAVRVAAKLRRGAVRRKQREARAAVAEADSPVPDSAWDDVYAVIQDEVQRLPASLRTAFLVCEVGGVSHAEAARQLGWKPGTLSGTLARAKQRLILRLGKRGIGPAAAVALVGGGAATGPAAVPWRLVEAVSLFPKAAAGVVPVVLAKLAAEGLTMGVSYTKLLAVAVVAAGGLAVGVGPMVLPVADAQQGVPGAAVQPMPAVPPVKKAEEAAPRDKTARPGDDISIPGLRWEYKWIGPRWAYKLVEKPGEVDLAAFLDKFGREGWEYAGLVSGKFALSKNSDAADQGMVVGQYVFQGEVMVFKRPVPPAGANPTANGLLVPTQRNFDVLSNDKRSLTYEELDRLGMEVARLKQEFAARGLAPASVGAAPVQPGASHPTLTTPALPELKSAALRLPPPNSPDVLTPIPVQPAAPNSSSDVPVPVLPAPPAQSARVAPPKPESEPEPFSLTVTLIGAQEAATVAEALLGKLDAAQGGPVRVRAVPTAGTVMVFGATPEVAKRIRATIQTLDSRAAELAEYQERNDRSRREREAKRSGEEKQAAEKKAEPKLPPPVKP